MSAPESFTARQLRDWQSFERVRKSGKFNMFDPRARRATGLDEESYVFVMGHFCALQKAVEDNTAAATGQKGGMKK